MGDLYRGARAVRRVWEKGRPVRLLGVGASKLTPAAHQPGLWDTPDDKERRLLEALDELRLRFGEHVVRRGKKGGQIDSRGNDPSDYNLCMDYRRDLRSKLLDGLLPAVALYLLAMLVLLPVDLVDWRFGRSGLLVYILGLMGVAMFSLQRALVSRYSETARAWYGMAGGLLAWSVLEIGAVLDNRPVSGAATMIVLMMAALVTLLLWRPHLPLGARFFMVACLAYGTAQLALFFFQSFSGWSPALLVFYRGLGLVSAAAALGVLAWIFIFSEWRTQRMWAALAVTLLATAAFYILSETVL